MRQCIQFLKNCFNRLRSKLQQPYELAQTPKNVLEKKTLVLDLDETLVHCEFKENPNFNYETMLEVLHRGVTYQVYIRRRPHLKEFLIQMSQLYEIVIFTAGYEAYCDKVLQYIDPDKYISDYFARAHCNFVNGNCIKDLTILEKPLDNLIFIDNTPYAFEMQPENGLLIPSYLDSDEDECLLKLIPFLKYMYSKHDVRSVSNYQKNYEQLYGSLFSDTQLTLICQPDDDNLSEGNVVKQEDDIELKHRKTQTLADQSIKFQNKPRSVTLLSG